MAEQLEGQKNLKFEMFAEQESAPTGTRGLSGWQQRVAALVAIAFTLFHLYTAAFGAFPNLIQRSIHVSFGLALTFLLFSSWRRGSTKVPLLDWLFVTISVISPIWIYLSYDRFMARVGLIEVDIVLGSLTILLVLEAARRVIGWVFTILASVFLAYAFLGTWLPMPFTHRGLTLSMVVNHLYTTDMGLWGVTTHITATVVAIFIIFGSILLFSGGGRTFMNLALLLAGKAVGGPAKVATVASSLFATVSGSAAANVAVTGSFSIPMMKRLGYNKNFASAVEATASTGGQLMPPIMGAGAFIMAELLGVPYIQVMLAAIVPAALFYIGVFMAIHFESKRRAYVALPNDLLPEARDVFAFKQLGPFVLPIAALLIFLFLGYSPQRAGFSATMLAIGLYIFTDLRWKPMKERLGVLLGGIERAGYALVLIAVLAATAQIIIGIIGATGVGVRFTGLLISASGGELLLGLLLTTIIALILGMGMPTTGAYLLAASVLAPALVRIGLDPLQAHMFIFYFAIISAITPPVCVAVFVACGISGGEWSRAAWIAVRIGAAAFIIPFMFAYSPTLLLIGQPLEVGIDVLTAVIGVVSLAAGVSGYLLLRNLAVQNLLLISGAALMIGPGVASDLPGLMLILVVVVWQLVARRSQHGAARA